MATSRRLTSAPGGVSGGERGKKQDIKAKNPPIKGDGAIFLGKHVQDHGMHQSS